MEDLQICPVCKGKLVYPTRTIGLTNISRVSLRCPECFLDRLVEVSNTKATEFLQVHIKMKQALERQVKRLEKTNMEEEIEKFVYALNRDYIQPLDF